MSGFLVPLSDLSASLILQLMKTLTKMKKKTRVVKKMFQSTQMRNMTSLARLLTTEPVKAKIIIELL